MSTQDQRAKFEEWLELAGFDVRRYHHIDGYHGNEQQAAWEAWQAALDSICVELPKPFDDAPPYASYQTGWNDAIGEIQDATHAAGVKTK